MKKVISFSLWGDNPKYLNGALENIRLQRIFYPSWTCRFYCHDSVPDNSIDLLEEEKAEVYFKTGDLGSNMKRPGMFWRFEVIKDPDVERFIVRDADSRLSQREKNCVLDWIKSEKGFHIIRDNPYHSTKIMGGMWGATRNLCEKINYDELLDKFNTVHKNENSIYGSDQDFLARFIYPLIKDDCLIHDDYHFYKEESVRKIPHIRINNEFIGQPYD